MDINREIIQLSPKLIQSAKVKRIQISNLNLKKDILTLNHNKRTKAADTKAIILTVIRE